MRRRNLLAGISLVAADRVLSLNTAKAAQFSSGPAQNATHATAENQDLPKFQPAGAQQFIRPDIHTGDRPAGASFATRSPALGCSGAACTAHPVATQAAIEILKRGGSAVDAAVAANAVLGFVEPVSSGLGGDCFAFVWDPKVAKLAGMASSGRSPKSLSLATVRSRAIDGHIPAFGAVSISTPGALDGWWLLHQRYGKLKWAELFEPAIHYCEAGDPVPQIIGYYLKPNLELFLKPGSGVEETANLIKTYMPGGVAPNEYDVRRNPDLAQTYRIIAEGGRDAFYDGQIAKSIDAYFKRIGGWLSADDLRDHHAEWVEPLVTEYRGVSVYGMPANTQGLATLQMLNIMEQFDLRELGFQSSQSIHVQAEAKRLAFEDRARYYADPQFAKIPIEWLNSKEYAKQRAALIRMDGVMPNVHAGQEPGHGETTYFTTADNDGLMVSMIQSNFRGMGSGLVADGLGFMFQDRGQLFSLQNDHPNIYAPGKRPFQTIIPGFAAKNGVPWFSFGVMGGDMQPQGQAQIIANRVDYGLDVQGAADSPRWYHEGSSQTMGEDRAGLGSLGMLHLESGVPVSTRKALDEMGWPIGPARTGFFGRYEAIELLNNGGRRVYAAGSEVRADAVALAF